MSIRIMSEVWRTDLPTTEKMVLLVIADHASDDGTEAWPSQATIAKKASISIRTVQRCVNNLVKAKYLRMEKHMGGSATCREDRRPHRYTINLWRLRSDNMTTREIRVDNEDIDGATIEPSRGDNEALRTTLDPYIEPPVGFDDFWKIYPLKVGKKSAQSAYKKALKRSTHAEIMEGALRYSRDPNRHPSYTAHASTWLNGDRWGDDPLPPRELSPEEKKLKEVESARIKSEKERERQRLLDLEAEQSRSQAVPMPEEIKRALLKTIGRSVP